MELPELDAFSQALSQLLVAALRSGWGGLASLVGALGTGFLIYLKAQKLYKKYVEEENQRRAREALVKNPVQNIVDERAHEAAEKELEAIIKGENDAGASSG